MLLKTNRKLIRTKITLNLNTIKHKIFNNYIRKDKTQITFRNEAPTDADTDAPEKK